MCEIPSNALQAEEFLAFCDGFSIGSNDLSQLTLGVDRDNGMLTGYDERNPAVRLIAPPPLELSSLVTVPPSCMCRCICAECLLTVLTLVARTQVLKLMKMAIDACLERGKYVGICGQAPSDFPEITAWLVKQVSPPFRAPPVAGCPVGICEPRRPATAAANG
jgi:pyruvate,water dikinase